MYKYEEKKKKKRVEAFFETETGTNYWREKNEREREVADYDTRHEMYVRRWWTDGSQKKLLNRKHRRFLLFIISTEFIFKNFFV